MNDIPYLMRGIQEVITASSTLVSSSPFLNEPRLRDWIATHFMRQSGKDLPTTSDAYKLHFILKDVLDFDRIEALFTEERKRSPEIDAWFGEGFRSSFTIEDLLGYPEGSLGHVFGRYLSDNGYQLEIMKQPEPRTQFEYYSLRNGQTHDLEHIVTGGGFDILGELVPYFARLSNIPRFLSPELAGLVNAQQLFGSLRIFMRTGLHYQQAFPMAMKAIQAGMSVGEASAPLFMIKYEDALHLPVPEAREKLGIRGAWDLDTREASLARPEYH